MLGAESRKRHGGQYAASEAIRMREPRGATTAVPEEVHGLPRELYES
jgi:hypothetical protein